MPRQHLRFVREYLQDHDAVAAAIRSGVVPAAAHETAARLLADPGIAARVARHEFMAARRSSRKQARLARELSAAIERAGDQDCATVTLGCWNAIAALLDSPSHG